MKRLIRQFLRFSAVGVSAFALDYVLLLVLVERLGMQYLLAATLSFTISIVYSYFLSMRFVYTRRGDISRTEEIIAFFVVSFIGLALNDALLYLFAGHIDIDYRIAKVIVGVIVSFWNFVSRKVFVDKDRFHDLESDFAFRESPMGKKLQERDKEPGRGMRLLRW
ncbi:GtrA family protein [Slackia heliotrinireducens]|uniref:GtrA family protein n=1 Tax=Slackia heliotrinireducens TaxID=84110 RepID=UPI003314ACB4